MDAGVVSGLLQLATQEDYGALLANWMLGSCVVLSALTPYTIAEPAVSWIVMESLAPRGVPARNSAPEICSKKVGG